jgi:hypothetical protein
MRRSIGRIIVRMRPQLNTPRRHRLACWLVMIGLLATTAALPFPAAPITVEQVSAVVHFPDEIEFSFSASSPGGIDWLELEYALVLPGQDAVVQRVTPDDFLPSPSVTTSWVWDMRETGSLPTGARISWRWNMVDAEGRQQSTSTEIIEWIDDVHPWQERTSANLTLAWYEGEPSFAEDLLHAASDAQQRLKSETGVESTSPVRIYIYADSQDLREAVLFEAEWTGGLAYPDHRIVLIGVSPSELSWGRQTIAHEMAHVLVGERVHASYSSMPNWLSEGLAVVAEGGLDEYSQQGLEQAIAEDTLFSVRSLNGGFTEQSDRVFLAYAESYSLVAYLIDRYGQASMLALLDRLQQGFRTDHALEQVYSFDTDGLEIEWRQAVGATPHPELQKVDRATPTVYPTFIPYGAPPVAATATPQSAPPSSPTGTGDVPAVASTILCAALACLAGLAVAGLVLAVLLLRGKRHP